MKYLAATLILLGLISSPAEARHHHRHYHQQNFLSGIRSIKVTLHRVSDNAQIVSHPSGCPRSAFCGCGAAVRIFGQPVRELWLAANWFKFPRTSPAPGAVAVRSHHVMVLESHIGGDVWQVYDANSGGHSTRIHARSIAGYTIVQPRA